MAKFESFSPAALGFLRHLRANNTKEWFAANKAIYETHLKEASRHFADNMADALLDLTGQTHSSKIFRIHRDVRFSKDKTPYNAHLHIAFIPDGNADQPPMWFFGLSPDDLALGCGVFQYEKEALDAFRTEMAGPKGAEVIQLAAEMRKRGFRVGDPELKRVPSGFDKDHPNDEALRRKGFTVWTDLGNPAFAIEPNLIERTIELFDDLLPVFLLLSRVE